MATALLLSLPPASAVVSITVFVALLCACILVGHLLEGCSWANESIASLLLGLCAGLVTLLVTRWRSSRLLSFDEVLFFVYLLPPIIFNAGFQVKKKQFFRNFSAILLFGVLGTLISFIIISTGSYFLFKQIVTPSLGIQEYLAIGAIFSATDSVCTLQVLNQEETPLLYSLVFGEGVVNDATSIVLFNAVQSLDLKNVDTMTALKLLGTFLYLFFTSTALGIVVGLVSAYVIKKLYFGRHSTNREVAVMLLLAYLSYMIAELLSLSGILTIFFCGIIMSHYTWHNVTEQSRITTRHAFAAMSFISETFIFLYVGMDALDVANWKVSGASVGAISAASGTLIILLMVGRATFVFSLASFANCYRSGQNAKVDLKQQFIIWWAGLMRGAVTIALSYNQFSASSSKKGAFMLTTSTIVVLFSTVVFGSVTKPLIRASVCPDRRTRNGEEDTAVSSLDDMQLLFPENSRPNDNDDNNHTNPGSSLGMLMMHPTSTTHSFWRKFDDSYMRPIFGGRDFVPNSAPIAPEDGNV